MTAEKAKTEAPTEAAVDDSLTLTEFCIRQSISDKRVEMIGAFEFTEKAAGRVKDSAAAFASRYAAFTTKAA